MKSSDVPASQGTNRPRVLPARRLILLATTIASLGAAALVVGPGLNLSSGYPAAVAQNLSEQARKLQAPVGFADIVEKVKPAVISVRGKSTADRRPVFLAATTFHPIARILPAFWRLMFRMAVLHATRPRPHVITGQALALASADGAWS